MMPNWLWMVVLALVESLSARRDARLRFLRQQLELALVRIPGNRVILTPEERKSLLRLGKELNHDVHDVLGIVSVKSYKRWLREERVGIQPKGVGRHRVITASLRALLKRMVQENASWGVRRVVGEFKKLGLKASRSSIRRVMVEEEFIPDPNSRVPKGIVTPWRTFLTAHANVMVATDFFCKAVWTPLGKRMAYVLMFIHVGSRKVMVSPSTFCPNEEWMRQQGRNVLMWLEDQRLECHDLIRDNDAKYPESFDAMFERIGVQIVPTPYQAPKANSFAESWIAGLKRECLNHLICFSLKQLDYITAAYVDYFNHYRPHQSLENVPPALVGQPPPISAGRIRRQRILGGLLNHYERKAA